MITAGAGGRAETKGWQSRAVQRWNGLDDVPAGYGPSVVTIGNFDGVHRGHAAVLTRLVADARRAGAHAVAITFDPHPVAVLFPERAPAQLSGIDEKLELLAATGLDAVLVMEFTRELAAWEPDRFVREVLVDALGASVVVVGRDTRFGRKNSGDVTTLRALGDVLGFRTEVIDDLGGTDDAHPSGRRWSSTWARELIVAGDVVTAAEVLGRAPRVVGTVVHGDHRGRDLGYPTANLSQDSTGLVPADGVYAGQLVRLGRAESDPEYRLPAAISVGTNPTFDGTQRRVEAYVLDRDDLDLYGERVAVEFVKLLRPTLRFDGIETLIAQMVVDVEQSRAVLGVTAPAT
jgi:riboflavin kinase/FMN adenylyltransferase